MNQAARMRFYKYAQHNEEKEENLVDVTGIEPVTPCLQRLVARRINKLHQVRWNARDCYKYMHCKPLSY
jgi:hypothetical protein